MMSAARGRRGHVGALLRRRHVVVAIGSMAGAFVASSSLQAQAGCAVTPASVGGAADVCRKADDLFRFLVPQVGVAVAGGNPILGEGGTMGGVGKRAISLRLVGVEGYLPRNTVPLNLSGPAVASDFGATRTVVPLPSVDAAIGISQGIPVGLTNIGGVDFLAGATMLPSVSQGDLQVKPKGTAGVAFSYGVRIGALQESALFPGISASYMVRKLPKVDFGYTPGNDTLSVAGTSVKANAIRIVASKRLALIGVAAGVGRDQIEASSSLSAVVNETVAGVPQRASISTPLLAERVTRNTAFVNVSLSFIVTRLVAEYGWSSAGASRATLNRFGGRQANEGYRYGSLGLTTRF
jgi:hypothetical protein